MTGKHIAIVGYGSAALMIIKTLQDLPYELRKGFRITVFERREGLGGQWLPDNTPQDPRNGVPLTGLYENLRTNTPVHMMTFPHVPFPDGTDLFPPWRVVLDYLYDYAQKWGLYSSSSEDWDASASPPTNGHSINGTLNGLPPLRPQNTPPEVAQKELPRRIICNRELYSAEWVGSTALGEGGHWKAISKPFPPSRGSEEYEDTFDAIIDATGHLVHPSIPTFEGQDEWLDAKEGREIMHSAYYRGPKAFTGKTVLVIGSGPSGLDGSLQIGTTAKELYHSVTPTVVLPPSWPFERKARISHFTKDAIVFQDGSTLEDVDSVYLGTGFIIRYQYLERTGMLQRRPGKPLPRIEDETFPGLVSTDLYVRPLFEHTVSFAQVHGPASLFWCGNIMSTSYRFSNAVQAALIAWCIALPSILPSLPELRKALEEDEARTKALGRAVEKVGHRQGAPHLGESEAYQRRIVAFLKGKGIEVGNSDEKTGLVMEPWREEVRKDFWQCMRGWMRQERLGETEQLRKECIGEEGYAKVSRKVIAEQKIVEKDRNPLESEISGWY